MSTLFSGGRIFDGMGSTLDDHAVLVEDQKIQRIAPQAEFSGFDGEVVDISGGTLLPGLIDCHVHLVYCGEADPGAKVMKLKPGQIVMRGPCECPARPFRGDHFPEGPGRQRFSRICRPGCLQFRRAIRSYHPCRRPDHLYDRRSWKPAWQGCGRTG